MRGKVGQNISYLKSYSGRVCIDAFKQAEVPVQVGADLRVEVITKGDLSFNGVYLLVADESFTVKITGGSPATLGLPEAIGFQCGIIIAAKPGQSAQLHLLFPVRTSLPKGIRLIRPGYSVEQADTQVFTTEYIDLLKKLNTGCIRLMDVMRTNGSECTDSWCDPDETLWGVKGRGAPLEPLIQLAAHLDADVWLNVPHKATDAYAREAATVLRETLFPDARVYLEYSNEVWNNKDAIALNTAYVKAQAAAAGMSYRQWYAKRSKEIADIFLDVFKGQEYRVVPLLAGQWGDSGVLRDSLAYGWKPKAVSIAGYFSPTTAEAGDAFWKGEQVRKFNETAATVPDAEKIIYEWACVGLNVNDPQIGPAIDAWGRGAFANGITQACNFVPVADADSTKAATNEVGAWTPKCQALADLSAAHPHPYAEPPPDPRDVEIATLKAQIDTLNTDRAGLIAETQRVAAERDAAMADHLAFINECKAMLSKVMEAMK